MRDEEFFKVIIPEKKEKTTSLVKRGGVMLVTSKCNINKNTIRDVASMLNLEVKISHDLNTENLMNMYSISYSGMSEEIEEFECYLAEYQDALNSN